MKKNLYSLTAPQKSILLTEQYYKGSSINNVCGTAFVEGEIDFDLLKKAVNLVIEHNDSFRLQLCLENNEVKQYLKEYEPVDIEIIDVATKEDVALIENNLMKQVFDIYSNLFTFKLFRFPNESGGFLLNIHHLISDSWTLGLTAREIIRTYSSLVKKEEPDFSTFSSYTDYIESEQEYIKSDKFQRDKEYWNSIFETIPDHATIPSIKPNHDDFSCMANRLTYTIDKSLMNQISDFCQSNHISSFNFFMAIYAIYIGRVSNVDDFVIGTPILNRTNFKEKNTTGMFINTAPIRINLSDEIDFKSFVDKIAKDSLSMLRHQKYSYQYILDNLRKENPNLPSLYNILISYQVTKANTETGLSYETRWAFNGNSGDNLDIHMYDINDTGSVNIAYDYRINKYDETEISAIHERILHIINQVLAYGNICVNDIEIVTPNEKNEILYKFNDTATDYPKDKTVIDLFEEQVRKTPNSIAIVCNNESLTYSKLNKKANQLAHYLISSGVHVGDIIAIMINRSVEMIVGLLGILKSGATYLPIDPDYPLQRICYMLENSQTKKIIVNNTTCNLLPERCEKINISLTKNFENCDSTNPNLTILPWQLMYLIYTSGSTGNPKGVMLTHQNIHNFIVGITKKIDFSSNKTIVSLTTICFDIFVLEIWCSLTHGLQVVIANELEQKDVVAFNALCLKYHICMIQTTPSRLSAFLDNPSQLDYLSNLTDIMVGGEPLPEILLKRLKDLSNAKIYNMYGPTETAVWSTIKDLSNTENISIGKPIANTTCYILDSNKNLLPPYIPGELYIGGDGVSNGYLTRKELTKEKFVNSPFHADSFIYNTGDLAYFTNDGEIVHLGRSDFQIKIRGYRVELGEIENTISSFEQINNCVVICHNVDNRQILCAYYTSDYEVDISSLKNFALTKLPAYMIPSHFIHVSKFPQTPNGKIDRKEFKFDSINDSRKLILPQNETEQQLYDIIASITHTSDFSMTDDLFSIGMDSIGIINLCTQIYNNFGVHVSIKEMYEINSIIDLAKILICNNTATYSISKALVADSYPLSSAQSRIYYATKIAEDDNILYNISGGILINTMLDASRIEDTFQKLVQLHSSFRTCIKMIDNEPRQIILDKVDFHISVQNATEADLDSIINHFPKAFNLELAPLLRIHVYYLDNKKTLILIDSHHIILDGTSLNILIRDFCKLYNNMDIEELNLDYVDYAIWENDYINSNDIKNNENYWVNHFKDSEIPAINLPYDYSIPAKPSYIGDKISMQISDEIISKINAIAREIGCSPYMLFLATFYILLYKYTSQDNIIVGSPVANRYFANLQNIVGMFVNNIALSSYIDSSKTFRAYLEDIKNLVLDALSNQPYPYDLLVRKLNLSGKNLFDVMFTYQNMEKKNLTIGNDELQIIPANTKTSKFNLSLEIIPDTNTVNLEYRTDLFKKDTVTRILNHYINLLSNVENDMYMKISDISMLSEEERKMILYDFNDTKMEYPKDKTIIQLFEEQVKKNPDNIAVVFEDRKLTYSELNEKANSLAWYLKEFGIKPQDIVGISMHRSSEILISMLAILKLGATYLPIDPTYPESRIEYIVKDSNVNLILTKDDLIDTFSHISNLINVSLETSNIYKNFPTTNLPCFGKPEYLAYVIYTSGSTGNPKGVMLTNKNVNNFITGVCNKIDFENYSSIVSVTTMCFDIFVLESLLPLQKGLTVVLANEDEQNIAPLLNTLCLKHNVEMLQTTPSRMSLLMSDESSLDYLKNLKCIMLGGEAFPINLLRDLQELTNAKIFNMYGPTETTVWSTIKNLTYCSSITVGTPIANTTCYILDKDLNPVPIGLPGELYIGGSGVSTGYLHRESLTKEKFIKNPFVDNGIIYNTGDLASWNDNGEINCLGRSDFQVKIRGLRIELGEIENKILSYPSITKTLVCIKEDNLKRQMLCGYFIANTRIATSDLKSYLGNYLANYMVPSHLIQLDDFKYTPNGKIDRNSLPSPKLLSSNSVIAPETPTEKKLIILFEELLCLSPISITDNFFEIGGDSILALKLQTKLMNENMNISYSDIYKYNTVKELALKIESNHNSQKALVDSSYDFTNINTILSRNVKENLSNLVFKDIGNVLLTGSTGFLGIHILAHIIDNTKNKVYCLIRKDPSTSLKDKLLNKLHYYFGIKYDNLIDDRIIILNSDITRPDLGLNDSRIKNVFEDISCIINSAAIVKHYGYYSDFEKINVTAVKNLVYYCKTFNKKFIQISTISVSGNTLTDLAINENHFENDIYFDENCLYIGQNLNNVYVRSKYEAEKLILEEMSNSNLDALILRIGNITNRSYDGKFQSNMNDNAFMHRIEALMELKVIPEYILNDYIEFSPVDLVAEAVIKSIQYYNNAINVLHIYNSNHVFINELISLLPFEVNVISNDDFKNILVRNINTNPKLIYITNDLDKDYNLIYSSNIKIRNTLSAEFFDIINFKWCNIDKNYIIMLLKQFYKED